MNVLYSNVVFVWIQIATNRVTFLFCKKPTKAQLQLIYKLPRSYFADFCLSGLYYFNKCTVHFLLFCKIKIVTK